jgi:exosortase A
LTPTHPTLLGGADSALNQSDRAHWRFVLATTGFAVAAVLAIYWSSVVATVNVWSNSDTYTFAFLVAPVSLYIIWDRRRQLAGYRVDPLRGGLLLLIPCGLLWLVSDAADVSVGRQLAVLGMLQGLLLSTLGWRIYKALLFPFLYLWLLVPAADVLLPSLQLFVTRATVAGLNLLGIPSTSDGILIVADGATYRIVEQCASLDFLLGSLAFSLVYANLLYCSFKRRAAFVGIALAAAVAANLFRTTSIIYLTDMSEGRIDLASDHQLYGWITFLVTVVILMLVGLRFREDVSTTPHEARTTGPDRRGAFVAIGIAAVLLASIAPAYALYTAKTEVVPANLTLSTPPVQSPWQETGASSDWQAVFPASDLNVSRRYVVSGKGVDLFIAYYWRQRPEAELVAWENRVADRITWHPLSRTTRTVEVEGQQIAVTESRLLAKKQRRRVVWHWHWIDGRFVADQLTTKLLQTKNRLLSGEQRAAFIAVSVEETEGTEAARAQLQSLIANALTLTPCLEGVGPAPASC